MRKVFRRNITIIIKAQESVWIFVLFQIKYTIHLKFDSNNFFAIVTILFTCEGQTCTTIIFRVEFVTLTIQTSWFYIRNGETRELLHVCFINNQHANIADCTIIMQYTYNVSLKIALQMNIGLKKINISLQIHTYHSINVTF